MPTGTPTMYIASGKYLSISDPDPQDIYLDDVAQGLSNICRFSGQTPRFYSVAEHSILVASLVSPQIHNQALFHDAAEAYLGDVPRPLKRLLPDYKKIEEKLLRSIFISMNIPWPTIEEWEEIHAADNQVLSLEAKELFRIDASTEWGLPTPSSQHLRCLPPADAKIAFLYTLKDRSN